MNKIIKIVGLAAMVLGLGLSIAPHTASAAEDGSFFGTFGKWLATPPEAPRSARNFPSTYDATQAGRRTKRTSNIANSRSDYRTFRDRNGNVDWNAYALKRVTTQEALQTGKTARVTSYHGRHAPGSIVISTKQRKLFLVLPGGKARQYSVGVGRPGFEWYGVHKISRKSEWPDWRPPAEMRKRQPYLPAFMPGGPGNPLGARALYLGSSIYRIHGTVENHTIGSAVSSGCIRMLNEDVMDLYTRVTIGTTVHVEL